MSISCQHGIEECEGNRIQSCALQHLSYLQSTKFICCMESESDFDAQGKRCLETLGIDIPTIVNCGNGLEGENLHYLNGLKTANLEPPPYFVPWIIFNDQFNDTEEMYDARKDLKSVLCKYILAPKPEICEVNDLNEE